jgi:hypothetical protein
VGTNVAKLQIVFRLWKSNNLVTIRLCKTAIGSNGNQLLSLELPKFESSSLFVCIIKLQILSKNFNSSHISGLGLKVPEG